VIDARTLAEADPTGGVLRYRELAWRAVVLPAVDTLPLAAWENLARFWRQGGLVIALGALPANSEREFPAPVVQSLARELFGDLASPQARVNAAGGASVYLPAGREDRLDPVLAAVLAPEVRVSAPASQLRITHRRIEGREVFFLINDSASAWEGSVDLQAAGQGQQCDPSTGTVTPLSTPNQIRVRLGPYGGLLFRFERGNPPARRPVTPQALAAAAG